MAGLLAAQVTYLKKLMNTFKSKKTLLRQKQFLDRSDQEFVDHQVTINENYVSISSC